MKLTAEQVRKAITTGVKHLETYSFSDEVTFEEAGLDSLDQLSILLALDELYEIVIPDEAVNECNSVQGILTYLKSNVTA